MRVNRGRLVVDLRDGRTIIVPLTLIPGLDAVPRWALSTYELIGDGIGIHFPALDDDLSVANLLHPELTMQPRGLPQVIDNAPRRRPRRRSGSAR